MAGQYGNQWQQIQDIFIQDRKALFTADSWRSMLFVALAFAALWLYNNKMSGKKSTPAILAAVLALLVVIDLWGVDRRYLNEKNFVSEQQIKLKPDQWDYTIDEMAARFGDQDYRVLNMATNTFNDSKPAAFHHQIGGYSAVKMRRYQDLIDFYLSRHINPGVLNMLNARYVVMHDGQVQRNPGALGNAWFVQDVKTVKDANDQVIESGASLASGASVNIAIVPAEGKIPTATINGTTIQLTESEGTYTGSFEMPAQASTLVINSGTVESDQPDNN